MTYSIELTEEEIEIINQALSDYGAKSMVNMLIRGTHGGLPQYAKIETARIKIIALKDLQPKEAKPLKAILEGETK